VLEDCRHASVTALEIIVIGVEIVGTAVDSQPKLDVQGMILIAFCVERAEDDVVVLFPPLSYARAPYTRCGAWKPQATSVRTVRNVR
jgi:hypothetical protein